MAAYGGNGACSSSPASLNQTVDKATTSTSLSAVPSPSNVGQSVTFTAAVGGSAVTPTGTVTFFVDGNPQATVGLNGAAATLTISTLVAGSHAIAASYNGDSNFATSTSPTLTHVVKSPGTHDLHGGVQSDISWRQSGGATAAWLMNGALVAQSGSLGAVPTSWQIVGQRDFNGDKKYDWLWRDSTTGTVAIWLMNGLAVSQSGSLGSVPSSWSVAGTGDFNGDGKGDILWRDSATGTVAIWLMNGLSVSQTGSLGAVSGNWSIVAAVSTATAGPTSSGATAGRVP